MKNIHIISTDKPSRLLYFGTSKELTLQVNPATFRVFERSTQNIYITSDEEIKGGDWVYNTNTNIVLKAKNSGKGGECNWYKIILTTDQDLIKDGIQEIDDEFLEWFVKNPSCEFVEVEKGYKNPNSKSFLSEVYKIYVPTEKSKQDALNHFLSTSSVIVKDPQKWDFNKQETLEEYIERETKSIIEPSLRAAAKSFLNYGAKWQQKQSYSEQEAFNMLMEFWKEERPEFKTNPVCVSNWFEQNKKK